MHPVPWKNQLALAYAQAQQADFDGMRATCAQIITAHHHDVLAQLDVGALLLNFGYIHDARHCFEQVLTHSPNDLRAMLNLANCARDAGDHLLAQQLYTRLQALNPNNPVIRRNVLVSQQYNPALSDDALLAEARAWGDWAIAQAGGPKPRPTAHALQRHDGAAPRPLRVGYVSADFCQHTVGLFIKDILKMHRTHATAPHAVAPVDVYAYSSGQVTDWVTHDMQSACTWRDVSRLDDVALAHCIQQDNIDVLVDLSGHTAGSRLTVFAHRPAPVQVSWLGYFASTGLRYIDAVLLDAWHAPAGTQAQFEEPIVQLPAGRLCYQPVPWAPEVAPLPCLDKGFVTFGSFNNTGKLNAQVFDVWAQVLASVPNSRLLLKWRTLADASLCASIHAGFAARGIDPSRVALRPASFHVDVLHQYAEIDIALDPFPFTGGLTSCEALWMGVPVITWPQSRVVSRQTYALLSAIGLTEWVAHDAQHYVAIAQQLTTDKPKLAQVRASMRQVMQASPLMDVDGFTQQLEQAFYALHSCLTG